ncbi:MAG TPA: hypothetical protein VET23_07800 [Chitinophagaceae bacterium]|nr:hypothetical protein [Chitinophagaceae bacterium]
MAKFDNTNSRRIEIIHAADFALRATCQLYQWVDNDSELFVANGCTVLFEFNSSFYCFSNAHVLADSQLGKTFFLLKDGTTMTVGGELFYSLPISSSQRKDDSLDIAIVKLNSTVAEHLSNDGQRFLNLNHIQTLSKLSKENVLLIAGYPASKTKVDVKEKRLKFNPLISRTIPYLKKVNNETFSHGLHHIAEFPIKSFKETSTGERMRAPKPHGISGSGLWLFPKSINHSPTLIGILSEYHENNAILISTKIDLFIDLLRHKFDPSIPNDGVRVELDYE